MSFKNDLTATQAAEICGVNRNTVNRYYALLRKEILAASVREAKAEIGEFEQRRVVFWSAACERETRAWGGGQDTCFWPLEAR